MPVTVGVFLDLSISVRAEYQILFLIYFDKNSTTVQYSTVQCSTVPAQHWTVSFRFKNACNHKVLYLLEYSKDSRVGTASLPQCALGFNA